MGTPCVLGSARTARSTASVRWAGRKSVRMTTRKSQSLSAVSSPRAREPNRRTSSTGNVSTMWLTISSATDTGDSPDYRPVCPSYRERRQAPPGASQGANTLLAYLDRKPGADRALQPRRCRNRGGSLLVPRVPPPAWMTCLRRSGRLREAQDAGYAAAARTGSGPGGDAGYGCSWQVIGWPVTWARRLGRLRPERHVEAMHPQRCDRSGPLPTRRPSRLCGRYGLAQRRRSSREDTGAIADDKASPAGGEAREGVKRPLPRPAGEAGTTQLPIRT